MTKQKLSQSSRDINHPTQIYSSAVETHKDLGIGQMSTSTARKEASQRIVGESAKEGDYPFLAQR